MKNYIISLVFVFATSLAAQDLAPKSDAPPSLWDNDLKSGIDLWKQDIQFPDSKVDTLTLYFAPNIGRLEISCFSSGGGTIVATLDGTSDSLSFSLKGISTNTLRLTWHGKTPLRLNEIRIMRDKLVAPSVIIPIDPSINVSRSR